MCFTVTATDATTFKLYTTGKDKKGNTTLSVIQTGKLKLNKATGLYEVQTGNLVSMQGGGTFYWSVESTNAKKGGNAYYTVELDERSILAPEGSNEDDWEDMMTAGYDGHIRDLGTITSADDPLLAEDWVGYGDVVDYYKFTVNHNSRIAFRAEATDKLLLSVGELTEGGVLETKYSLVKPKKSTVYSVETKTITLTAGKTYYLGVMSANYSRQQGIDGEYRVYINSFVSSGSDADALTMPETAAGLQDSLFAGQTADVLADASVANVLDDEAAKRLGAELSFLA